MPRSVLAWNQSTARASRLLSGTPAGPAGSSSGAGWSGALDAPREELTRVAEESHTAAEGAVPRAE